MAERLRSRGFGVYIVPEAATLLFTGGVSPAGNTDAQTLTLQTHLLRTQVALEDAFINVARSTNRPSFILCDRGTCDGRAYMPSDMWRIMLQQNSWDMVSIRDARYDLVVHLVTAAEGAETFYTLENNQTRTESASEAKRVDERTQAAWVGHPHLRIVDNRTDFRQKINRVFNDIAELAGLHHVRRIVRKFQLLEVPNGVMPTLPPGAEEFVVEQTYLSTGLGSGVQESVRRRGKVGGAFTYVHKVRRDDSETKRQINAREYLSLLAHADSGRRTVRIRRQCFLHNGMYFVLDCVSNVDNGIRLLRCHCEDGDVQLEIPKWLVVDREVTGDKKYSMHSLSQRVSPERVRGDGNEVQRDGHIGLDDIQLARSL